MQGHGQADPIRVLRLLASCVVVCGLCAAEPAQKKGDGWIVVNPKLKALRPSRTTAVLGQPLEPPEMRVYRGVLVAVKHKPGAVHVTSRPLVLYRLGERGYALLTSGKRAGALDRLAGKKVEIKGLPDTKEFVSVVEGDPNRIHVYAVRSVTATTPPAGK